MRKSLTILLTIIVCVVLNGQKTDIQRISMTNFIEKLQSKNNEEINISNIEIYYDTLTDLRYADLAFVGNHSYNNINKEYNNYDSIVINSNIKLKNVNFIGPISFTRILFRKDFELESVGGELLSFNFCDFQHIGIKKSNLSQVTFNNSKFSNLSIEELQHGAIIMQKCYNFGSMYLDNRKSSVNVIIDSSYFMNGLSIMPQNGDLLISNSKFDSHFSRQRVSFGNIGSFNKFRLINNKFNVSLHLFNISITETFEIIDCSFYENVCFDRVNFPENNSRIEWDSIKGQKLCSLTDDNYQTFKYKSEIIDSNLKYYLALIKQYAALLRIYKNNGDMESYNSCLIEMKDLQTKKMAFNYEVNSTLQNYFTFLLNNFLRKFCDYGTNPLKSLYYSIVVILFFSILYFLFLKNPVSVSFFNLYKRVTLIIDHFKLLINDRKKVIRNIKKMKKYLITIKWKFPASKFRESFVEFLDAIALSINAFVTLGFGAMPSSGISRYLAVIEGIIGWFLLSIFIASLISQIMQ